MDKSEQVERLQTARQRLKATHSIRVTRWAAEELERMRDRLEAEIASNPGEYPGYAGRNITLSDTITLLCERVPQ